jgi:hypothetical protein
MEQRLSDDQHDNTEQPDSPVPIRPPRISQLSSFSRFISLTLEARLNIKNPVRTSKKTPHFTITKINYITLFKQVIAVYDDNHTKCTVGRY